MKPGKQKELGGSSSAKTSIFLSDDLQNLLNIHVILTELNSYSVTRRSIMYEEDDNSVLLNVNASFFHKLCFFDI
jgi:hypothetical protein